MLISDCKYPNKVHQEVMVKGETNLSSIMHLKQVSDVVVPRSVASWDLGEGESAVLAYALKNPDIRTVIIDDREAQRCAKSLVCYIFSYHLLYHRESKFIKKPLYRVFRILYLIVFSDIVFVHNTLYLLRTFSP